MALSAAVGQVGQGIWDKFSIGLNCSAGTCRDKIGSNLQLLPVSQDKKIIKSEVIFLLFFAWLCFNYEILHVSQSDLRSSNDTLKKLNLIADVRNM